MRKGREKLTILRYFIFLDRLSLSLRGFRSLTLRRNPLHSQPFKLSETLCKFYCRTEKQFPRLVFCFCFVLFCVQVLCCNDSKYHSLNIFEKEQFSLHFFYSLLQLYTVYRVSFIFHLNAFLVPVKGFAYLFC